MIETEDRLIPSDTPGISLHLRRKRLRGSLPDRPVLLMHGATFPSASLFDVPIAGGASLMDRLARAGHDTYALDVRGYGLATRPPEMRAPAGAAPPIVRHEVAVRDLAATVEQILGDRGRLDLVGMSWGGSIAGAYAARRDARVRRLGLIAPLWLATGPVRIDDGAPLGAWRSIDLASYRERWLAAAPVEARGRLVATETLEAWTALTDATDPQAPPGTIRAPAGAVADSREHWTADDPLFDPAAIRAPVFIVHAGWDADVTADRIRALFDRLTGARDRRLLAIGEGTHMLILERRAGQAIDALLSFLDEADED